jgi:hypothetical protein
METRYGMAQRPWVMDRGMASEDNIAWLQESDRRHLTGTPRGELRKRSAQPRDERDRTEARDRAGAKLCTGPEGGTSGRSAVRVATCCAPRSGPPTSKRPT